jgi:NAD(P)H:quinone oxidoreductase type IV
VSQVAGAEPVVRTVPELIPAAVIESRADMKAGRDLQKDIPLVTADDFRQAGAIAFGTPTRFGNVSSQLKNQIDQLSGLWLKGELEGKPAGVFVSTGSLHGGQETTILTLMAPLLHLGMILVGVPYSVQELFTTQGWRFTLRTGACGWRRQPTRNRLAGGGNLPRLGSPLGRSWTAVANEVATARTPTGSAPHNQERGSDYDCANTREG